jgi:hypothetical protein
MLAGFVVAFSPWPIRNMVRFGQPWPFGTRVDRFSAPVPYYAGYYDWLTTWAVDQEVNPQVAWCFYDPTCTPQIDRYPTNAFASPEERKEVERLLALRRVEKFSARVSDGFEAVAHARRWHHPVDNFLILPMRRVVSVWINRHDDVMWVRVPWPRVLTPIRNAGKVIFMFFCPAMLAAGVLLARQRETRRLALILLSAIVVRSLFLGYYFYVEPRYAVEMMPLGLILISGAGVLLYDRWVRKKAA